MRATLIFFVLVDLLVRVETTQKGLANRRYIWEARQISVTDASLKLNYNRATMTPLRFKTVTEKPSEVWIEFYYGHYQEASGFLNWNEFTWQVELQGCTDQSQYSGYFFWRVPKDLERIWEITWNRKALTVKCNGRKVWKYKFKKRRGHHKNDSCTSLYTEFIAPLTIVKFLDSIPISRTLPEDQGSPVRTKFAYSSVRKLLTKPVEYYVRNRLHIFDRKKTKNPSEKVSEGSQKSSHKQGFGAIRSFKAAETIPKDKEHTNLSIKKTSTRDKDAMESYMKPENTGASKEGKEKYDIFEIKYDTPPKINENTVKKYVKPGGRKQEDENSMINDIPPNMNENTTKNYKIPEKVKNKDAKKAVKEKGNFFDGKETPRK